MPLRSAVTWILAVASVTLGALAGWLLAPAPLYASAAAVYVSPIMASHRGVGETVIPVIDSLVTPQLALLASPEVIEAALASPEWAALGRGASPDDREKFVTRLSIESKRGEMVVTVTFRDETPGVALVGVRAVLEAYLAVREARWQPGLQELADDLRTELRKIEDEIRSTSEEILNLTEPYGGLEGFGPAYKSLLERMTQNEAATVELRRSPDGDDDRHRTLLTEAAAMQEEAKALGTVRAKVASAVANRDHQRLLAHETRGQLRSLEKARRPGPRVQVLSRGSIATAPVRDERILYAGLGALAGALLFALSRLIWRR